MTLSWCRAALSTHRIGCAAKRIAQHNPCRSSWQAEIWMKFPCQMIEKLQFLLLMSRKENGAEMVVIPRVRKIMPCKGWRQTNCLYSLENQLIVTSVLFSRTLIPWISGHNIKQSLDKWVSMICGKIMVPAKVHTSMETIHRAMPPKNKMCALTILCGVCRQTESSIWTGEQCLLHPQKPWLLYQNSNFHSFFSSLIP